MVNKIYSVLFLCTGNSARSIMAEALLNSLGRGRFSAYSAGSSPAQWVHPLTLDILRKAHLSVEGLRSKSWAEFGTPSAPIMDFVFTVCDRAANEVCPVWPGQPMTARWGFEDPVLFRGSPGEQAMVFARVFREIRKRIELFLALPVERLDRVALKHEVDRIGRIMPLSAK
jgi:arsenate reductase